MTEEKPCSASFSPASALGEAEEATDSMADNTEEPRSMMFVLLVIISTGFGLVDIVPWSVTLSLFGLLIPVGIWYYLVMRERPKQRTVLSHSGPYMAYVLLFMLIIQAGRVWEANLWWEVASKWILIFSLGWFATSRIRTETTKNRIKDANERPI
ncbi:hypothetical protein ACX80E_02385 [Arthrobacter sp. TMN-49]